MEQENGVVENGVEAAPEVAEEQKEQRSREGSAGSQEGIQLSAIKIITRHDDEEEEEEEEESDSEAEEEEVKPKKTVKRKKKGKNEVKAPAEVLTHVLAKAIRTINEQKEKERQKLRQAEIRKMALEQKRKQELADAQRLRRSHCSSRAYTYALADVQQ